MSGILGGRWVWGAKQFPLAVTRDSGRGSAELEVLSLEVRPRHELVRGEVRHGRHAAGNPNRCGTYALRCFRV